MTAADEVQLDHVALSLLKADSSGFFTQPVDWPGVGQRCPEAKPANGTQQTVKPGVPLSCAVHLPKWTQPGTTRSTRRWSDRTSRPKGPIWICVSAHLGYSHLCLCSRAVSLAPGSRRGPGTVGNAWCSQSRPKKCAINISTLKSKTTDAGRDSRELITGRKRQLADIVEKLRTGADPSTYSERVDRIRDLLPVIARLYSLERQFGHPATDQTLYDQAKDVLSKEQPDLSECHSRLDSLETALRKAAAAQRGQAAQDAGDSVTPLFFFSWARGVSSYALRQLLSRYDHLIAAVSILIAVQIGMVTLWASNPTWGSLSDWLVAFLSGTGITVGGTISLQQIAQNYQLGSLTRR